MNSKELLQNWIDAFQRRDLEAVVACYADTAINFQIAAGEPAVGKDQIRKDSAALSQANFTATNRPENRSKFAAADFFNSRTKR